MLLIHQTGAQVTSGGADFNPSTLIGWKAGRVRKEDWLDAGGPLDATPRIPNGGTANWTVTGRVYCIFGADLRPGVLS